MGGPCGCRGCGASRRARRARWSTSTPAPTASGGARFGFYVRAYLIAAAAWVCRYAMLVFLVWAVTPEANGPLLFLRHMALSLGGMILPTPGGAGGIEGLFALFIGPMIVPAALMTPVLLVWRGLNFYVFLALGLPLSLHSAKIAREAR